jgi:hypothetical protein
MATQVLNLYTLYILSDVNSPSNLAVLCQVTGEPCVRSPLFAFSLPGYSPPGELLPALPKKSSSVIVTPLERLVHWTIYRKLNVRKGAKMTCADLTEKQRELLEIIGSDNDLLETSIEYVMWIKTTKDRDCWQVVGLVGCS